MKVYLLMFMLLCAPAYAQMEPMHHDMEHMHHDMSHMQMDAVQQFLMQQSSGTSANPASEPMAMLMRHEGDWMLMLHGSAFVSAIDESGPRGADLITSTNWIMGMAERPLAGGHLMLRSMLSLEPAVMTKRGYPELFQTGETAGGRALVDRQHPHDLFMEVAAEFAVDLGDQTIGYIYAAPVGDPALGPVAYPHRASATEIPQATLSHHLQDSTHIADSVLTLGAKRGGFELEISGFHGEEPDENRWDLDGGRIDSWAVRGTWTPTAQWSAQISTGHLVHPEALEAGNVQRTTASVSYADKRWAASLIWGHNHRSDHDTDGVVLETKLRLTGTSHVTGRFEVVDKDEILGHEVLQVKALTLGYTKDVWRASGIVGSVGGNVTLYDVPGELKPLYGNRPRGFYAFVRVRSAGG